ncbi:MAG: hypothetical protein II743_09060, partial [Lachnospiraceae bacterium]|nr:hypothetical protein [Lachnospiraceae bacterium]
MSAENNKAEELQEKREARRKRRIRNQILAYSVVIVLIIAIGAGLLAMISAVSKRSDKKGGPSKSLPVIASESESEQSSEEDEFSTETEEVVSSEPEESTEETEPVILEPTYEEKLDEIVNAAIAVMPLEDKVAGLFMVTPEILTGVGPVSKAGPSTKDALQKKAVGGILYRTQ